MLKQKQRKTEKTNTNNTGKKAAEIFWRLFLVVTGGLGVIWFMVPVLVGRLVHIGSITGILVCGIIAGYGIFLGRVNRILSNLWKKKGGRIVLCILAGFLSIILMLVVVLTVNMILAANRQPDENATVVVLGCRVYGEKASLSLEERLAAAKEYLVAHPQAVCILSGGQGKGEDISEAECMYRYLTERGIAKERLYLEEASTSTRENLTFSMNIIKEEGLNRELAIVTSEYHEYRANLIAGEMGISSAAVPASTAPWLFPAYYVRELYGILYEWVF